MRRPTPRSARHDGWLSDEDARDALNITGVRNLAVHMYRDQIGKEIEENLTTHAALLRRWLAALQDRPGAPD